MKHEKYSLEERLRKPPTQNDATRAGTYLCSWVLTTAMAGALIGETLEYGGEHAMNAYLNGHEALGTAYLLSGLGAAIAETAFSHQSHTVYQGLLQKEFTVRPTEEDLHEALDNEVYHPKRPVKFIDEYHFN